MNDRENTENKLKQQLQKFEMGKSKAMNTKLGKEKDAY